MLSFSRVFPVRDGIGVVGGQAQRFEGGKGQALPDLTRLALPGGFNLENAAAAYLATEQILRGQMLGGEMPRDQIQGESGGADIASAALSAALSVALSAALKAIAEFPGLPHRLERVGEVDGVVCYNDSYATRPDATLGALSAFEGPLALIVGGSEKHADFEALAERICRHDGLRRVVLIGTTGPRIGTEVRNAATHLKRTPPPLVMAETLNEAFSQGLEALHGKGVLLFSPACASFDMFPNYKVRGERFKALVAGAIALK